MVKNADTAMEPMLAVLRKLGKGDGVKYLRDPNTWKQIESDTVRLLLEQIDTARTQLTTLRDGFVLLRDTVTDAPLVDALLGFPERWLNAQSALNKERLGGMAAFEIIFTILTAGIGTAVNAAAKSKHLVKASEAPQKASKLHKHTTNFDV